MFLIKMDSYSIIQHSECRKVYLTTEFTFLSFNDIKAINIKGLNNFYLNKKPQSVPAISGDKKSVSVKKLLVIFYPIGLRVEAEVSFYKKSNITNKFIKAYNGNIASWNTTSRMRIAHLNIRGGLKHKEAEIDYLLDKYKLDIFGLSETNQLKRDVINTNNRNYVFEPGFTYSDEKTRLGVFVKRGISYKVNKNIMSKLQVPCVWLDLKIKGAKIAIVNVYREFQLYLPKEIRDMNSRGISEQYNRFENFIQVWMDNSKNYDEIWTLGDFNLDLDRSSVPSSQYRRFYQLLEDSVFNEGYSQLINDPTRVSDNGKIQSRIDHIYTNSGNFFNPLVVQCTGSDHGMVVVDRVCQGKFMRKQYRFVRSKKDFQYAEFIGHLNDTDVHEIDTIEDPETQVKKLTDAMIYAAEKTCPLKRVEMRISHTKWMTEELRDAIRRRDEKFSQYKFYSRMGNQMMSDIRFREYKKIRNFVSHKLVEVKRKYKKDNIEGSRVNNPKDCWRKLEETSGRNCSFRPPITLIEGGKEFDQPEIVANMFGEFFESKVDKIKSSLPDVEPTLPEQWGGGEIQF